MTSGTTSTSSSGPTAEPSSGSPAMRLGHRRLPSRRRRRQIFRLRGTDSADRKLGIARVRRVLDDGSVALADSNQQLSSLLIGRYRPTARRSSPPTSSARRRQGPTGPLARTGPTAARCGAPLSLDGHGSAPTIGGQLSTRERNLEMLNRTIIAGLLADPRPRRHRRPGRDGGRATGAPSSSPGVTQDRKEVVKDAEGNPVKDDDGKEELKKVTTTEGGLFAVKDGHLNQLTEDPTDTEPSFSPDGRAIVFSRGGDIFSVRADGSGLRRLTSGPGSTRRRASRRTAGTSSSSGAAPRGRRPTSTRSASTAARHGR